MKQFCPWDVRQITDRQTDALTDNMQFFVWHGSQNLCQTINHEVLEYWICSYFDRIVFMEGIRQILLHVHLSLCTFLAANIMNTGLTATFSNAITHSHFWQLWTVYLKWYMYVLNRNLPWLCDNGMHQGIIIPSWTVSATRSWSSFPKRNIWTSCMFLKPSLEDLFQVITAC